MSVTLFRSYYLVNSEESWSCCACALPALSDSFFAELGSESSFVTEHTPDLTNISANSLFMDDLQHINQTYLAHLNCRSLLPIVDQLRAVFQTSTDAILIAVTETWLNNMVSDMEVNIDGYKIERKDRTTHGGGTAIYIRNGTKYVRRSDLEESDIEAICIEMKIHKLPYLIVCVYRPPNFNNNNVLFDYLNDLTCKSLRERRQVIILGDLNADYLNNSLPQTKSLKEFLERNQLKQLITEPTRSTKTSNTLIDLIITSTPHLFASTGVIKSGVSDHFPIYGVLSTNSNIGTNAEHHTIVTRKIDSTSNHENFTNELNLIPWSVVMDIFDDPNDKLYVWEKLFIPIMDEYFPIRRKRIRQRSHPWINRDILILMRRRDRARKKAMKSGLDDDYKVYKHLRNKVTSYIRKSRTTYFKLQLENNSNDPKAFWKLMKKVLPSKIKQTEIEKITVEGHDITDSKGIENSLNSYFTSIATRLLSMQATHQNTNTLSSNSVHELNDYHVQQTAYHPESNFKFHPVTDYEIHRKLAAIKLNKATGHDKIPSKILRIAAKNISQSLAKLINSSLKCGIFPNKWKIAKVSSIFKGNIPSERDNYRPISVLSTLAKLCEDIADNQMKDYDNEHQTLQEPRQFAYTKNCSTATALIEVIDSWKSAIDQKQYTISVFLDLRKAFDVIDHSVLLAKLRNYAFGEVEVKWISSYLTDRQQYVVYQKAQSDIEVITKGVPQGSVLGPSLFCLYFNTIVSNFENCEPILYADDTEIHYSDKDLATAQTKVNQDMTNVDNWLTQNRMIANVKKTKAMLIGSRQAVNKADKIEIHLNNETIEQVTSFDYLGVRTNNILSWEPHISRLCQRTYFRINFLNRISAFLPKYILFRIYKQTILPIIDYCSVVWHDCGSTLTRRVEQIQNRAMRIILQEGRKKCTQEMRSKLKLLSLYSRRRFFRFIIIFKILNQLGCPQQLLGVFRLRSTLRNRELRDKTRLHLPKVKGKMGQTMFKYAGAKDWNSLPINIREITSINTFKQTLFTYLLDCDVNSHNCSL